MEPTMRVSSKASESTYVAQPARGHGDWSWKWWPRPRKEIEDSFCSSPVAADHSPANSAGQARCGYCTGWCERRLLNREKGS